MFKKSLIAVLRGLVRLYQALLSPFFGRQCRFQPTCSVYARDALEQHGPWRGTWLTVKRLSRCHPFKPFGACDGFTYDPMPPRSGKNTS